MRSEKRQTRLNGEYLEFPFQRDIIFNFKANTVMVTAEYILPLKDGTSDNPVWKLLDYLFRHREPHGFKRIHDLADFQIAK